MLWLQTISFIVLGVGVLLFVVVVVRAIPRVKRIDVSTIPEERARKVKERLILDKLQKVGRARFGWMFRFGAFLSKVVSTFVGKITHRLRALEEKYERLKQVPRKSETLDVWVKQIEAKADEYMKKGSYASAEKQFIEIISHQPKKVEAYEGLGHAYLQMKQYTQARETFLFAQRLAPEDASVQMSLGEVALAEGKTAEALRFFREAVRLRPKNPKYLDSYIEAALTEQAFDDAQKGYDLLLAANPDNQKLPSIKDRLHKSLPV